MKHSISHPLTTDMARKVCDFAFEKYSEKFADYNPTAQWATDTQCNLSFNAKGVTLDAKILLVPSAIEVEMKLPFLFKPFQKKAIGLIEGEITKWIERAENGEFEG